MISVIETHSPSDYSCCKNIENILQRERNIELLTLQIIPWKFVYKCVDDLIDKS